MIKATTHNNDKKVIGRITWITDNNIVTTPPEIISYYRLNHSIWSLSDNKEVSR
jgi:hypothetical protein